MPRRVDDYLVGYTFMVTRREDQPINPEDGSPALNEDGSPLRVPFFRLTFHDAEYALGRGGGHAVIVDMLEQNRDELVRQLTGGIVLGNGRVDLGIIRPST
jgi:hypothetical protein